MDDMTWDELAEYGKARLNRKYEEIGYTGTFVARLGNGNPVNPTVRHPTRHGYVFVYRELDGSNDVSIVYDCNGLVPLNNKSAGKVAFCGYRPGESKDSGADPVIYSLGEGSGGAFDYLSGLAPQQLETWEQQLIRPDRFRWMHVVPDGGFQLFLIGGIARLGNTLVVVKNQVFGDVGSHQPTGTNEARWVLCLYHLVTKAKIFLPGDIFPADGSVDKLDYIPVAIPQSCEPVGLAYLYDTQTKLKDPDMLWSPNLFFTPTEGDTVETFYALAGTDTVVVGTDNVVAGS